MGIASIGVSTYGDKQNMDMVRKFGFMPKGKEELESSDMDKEFPKLMYFKPGDIEGSHYTGAVTKAAMLKFLGIEERTCDVLTGAFCFTFATALDYNIVQLDNASFPLVVGKKLPVFLRFDKDFPYGAKADAFKAVAAVTAKS